METILEQQRRQHEERERIVDCMVKEMIIPKKTVKYISMQLQIAPSFFLFKIINNDNDRIFSIQKIRYYVIYSYIQLLLNQLINNIAYVHIKTGLLEYYKINIKLLSNILLSQF